MSEDTNGGPTGRFLRIENKLDALIASFSGFQLDMEKRLIRLELTTIEAKTRLEDAAVAARAELGVSSSEARGKLEIAASDARASVVQGTSQRTLKWMIVGIVLAFVVQAAGILFNAFRIGNP